MVFGDFHLPLLLLLLLLLLLIETTYALYAASAHYLTSCENGGLASDARNVMKCVFNGRMGAVAV